MALGTPGFVIAQLPLAVRNERLIVEAGRETLTPSGTLSAGAARNPKRWGWNLRRLKSCAYRGVGRPAARL
jgi:hypothetical protein